MKHTLNMKMTISVSKKERMVFDELCNIETHGPSDQFRHILKYYLKSNNGFKPLLKMLEEKAK